MKNALFLLMAMGLLFFGDYAQAGTIGDYPENRIIAAARSDQFIHNNTQFFRVNAQEWSESIQVTTIVDGNGVRTYTVSFLYTPQSIPFGQVVGVRLDADLNPIGYFLS